jgi:hypothetical protein
LRHAHIELGRLELKVLRRRLPLVLSLGLGMSLSDSLNVKRLKRRRRVLLPIASGLLAGPPDLVVPNKLELHFEGILNTVPAEKPHSVLSDHAGYHAQGLVVVVVVVVVGAIIFVRIQQPR